LIPPLSPTYRTQRLLTLTLRDLRRLAMHGRFAHWERHVYGRLEALPAEATPRQHAEVLAALSLGTEIIRFRTIARRFTVGSELDDALADLVPPAAP
jgi:hypothetical protein